MFRGLACIVWRLGYLNCTKGIRRSSGSLVWFELVNSTDASRLGYLLGSGDSIYQATGWNGGKRFL